MVWPLEDDAGERQAHALGIHGNKQGHEDAVSHRHSEAHDADLHLGSGARSMAGRVGTVAALGPQEGTQAPHPAASVPAGPSQLPSPVPSPPRVSTTAAAPGLLSRE